MVKFLRHAPLLQYLRLMYDKPLGYKLKALWSEFEKHNPTIALFGTAGTALSVVLGGLTIYLAHQENPVRKYYDHIRIFRPDDPRVKTIRTDDSIGMTYLMTNYTMLPKDY